MSLQYTSGLLGFIHFIEGRAHGLANERLVDPLAAQFLLNPLRAVALALRTPERPIPSEIFVIQIIEAAKFLDRRVGETGRAAAPVKISANFSFAAGTVPKIM